MRDGKVSMEEMFENLFSNIDEYANAPTTERHVSRGCTRAGGPWLCTDRNEVKTEAKRNVCRHEVFTDTTEDRAMEKSEKGTKFGKSVFGAIISYVIISVIAGVCSVLRGGMDAGSNAELWFMMFEFVLFPALFYAAGYVGSKIYDFEKFKGYKAWLFMVGFSGILLLFWYILLEAYVLLNLPAAEGSIALDLFLRKITVVIDYSVLYLKETPLYKYGILPVIHFVFRLLYWLFYVLGNRKYALVQKERRR